MTGRVVAPHSLTVEVTVTVTAVAQPGKLLALHHVLGIQELTLGVSGSDDGAGERSNCEDLVEAEHVDGGDVSRV